jgi:hypothetical protein
MTVTKISRDNNITECISESHLQFMRDFIEREEVASRKTLDLFLAEKLNAEAESMDQPEQVQLAKTERWIRVRKL